MAIGFNLGSMLLWVIRHSRFCMSDKRLFLKEALLENPDNLPRLPALELERDIFTSWVEALQGDNSDR